MQSSKKMLVGTVCMLVSTIAYGFISTVSIKALNAGAASETLLFDKFLYSAILIWAYIFIKKLSFKVKKEQIITIISVCIAYNLLAACLIEAFQLIPGNLTIVLNFTYPAMIIVFESIARITRINKVRIGSVVFSLIGLLLILLGGSVTINIPGILFALGAAVSQAWYVLSLGSRKLEGLHPVVAAGFVTLSATVVNFIRVTIDGDVSYFTSGAEQLIWTLVLSFFCAFLAILLFCIGVSMIGSGRAAVINTLEPVVACVAGYLFLGETMNFNTAFGCVAIVIAVFIINFDGKKEGNEVQS